MSRPDRAALAAPLHTLLNASAKPATGGQHGAEACGSNACALALPRGESRDAFERVQTNAPSAELWPYTAPMAAAWPLTIRPRAVIFPCCVK